VIGAYPPGGEGDGLAHLRLRRRRALGDLVWTDLQTLGVQLHPSNRSANRSTASSLRSAPRQNVGDGGVDIGGRAATLIQEGLEGRGKRDRRR